MITVLAGGVGAARFLRGLVRVVDPADVTVVVNVGDDIDLFGLRICPDLDTVTYWLGGAIDPERQWGRSEESYTVRDELGRFTDPWFTLGDRDLATHLYRTGRLADGATLTVVAAEIAAAWEVTTRILPATDDRMETRIHTTDGRDLHFQEYWVRERAAPDVSRIEVAGASSATPADGVLEAFGRTDAIVLAPSNPVVSIGTVLAVPGVREAIDRAHAPVVGVSPIIGGDVVRGMAHRLLPVVGADVSATGVARYYGELLDGWVIDETDRDLAPSIRDELGIDVTVTDTLMDDIEVAGRLAATTLELARSIA